MLSKMSSLIVGQKSLFIRFCKLLGDLLPSDLNLTAVVSVYSAKLAGKFVHTNKKVSLLSSRRPS